MFSSTLAPKLRARPAVGRDLRPIRWQAWVLAVSASSASTHLSICGVSARHDVNTTKWAPGSWVQSRSLRSWGLPRSYTPITTRQPLLPSDPDERMVIDSLYYRCGRSVVFSCSNVNPQQDVATLRRRGAPGSTSPSRPRVAAKPLRSSHFAAIRCELLLPSQLPLLLPASWKQDGARRTCRCATLRRIYEYRCHSYLASTSHVSAKPQLVHDGLQGLDGKRIILRIAGMPLSWGGHRPIGGG